MNKAESHCIRRLCLLITVEQDRQAVLPLVESNGCSRLDRTFSQLSGNLDARLVIFEADECAGGDFSMKPAELLKSDALSEVVLLGAGTALFVSLLLILIVAATASAGFWW